MKATLPNFLTRFFLFSMTVYSRLPTSLLTADLKALFTICNSLPTQSKYMLKLTRPLFRALSTPPIDRILMEGPWIAQSIHQKLKEGFNPFYLEVINESHMHNVPKDAETHFKVVIGSEKFENVNLLQRHRMVNSLFEREFENGLHALSIVAKTNKEMENYLGTEPSPTCRGGFGK